MAITRPAPIGLAELHRQAAHPAGGRVHHHRLARSDAGRGAVEVPGGEALDQQREGRLVGEALSGTSKVVACGAAASSA